MLNTNNNNCVNKIHMKESRFNLYFNAQDGTRLAFNSLSGGLAIVDDDYKRLITSIARGEPINGLESVLSAAKYGNFIVDADKDEVLDYETKRLAQFFNAQAIGLTIAPTLDCNFKCVYCYETRRRGNMSEGTQHSIINYVKRYNGRFNDVEVTWYGGEPLLCMPIISNLSKELINICKERAAVYHAFIITNGFLITQKVVDEFKRCKITGAQVTIDGPREVHESRRVNRSGSGSFDSIVSNVNLLLKNGVDVIVRINVDKSNEKDVGTLIEYLSKELVSKKVKITFGQVSAYTESCKGIESSCFGNEEFACKMLDFYRLLEKCGFGESNKFPYPNVKLCYCCAEHVSSFVIDPEGNLYKCWNDVGNGNLAVGNINDQSFDFANYKCGRWLLRQLPKKCKECNVLPICAGGCPHVTNVRKKANACDLIRYNIEETMLDYYERYASAGN